MSLYMSTVLITG